jgi:hypothetical protein
METRWNKYSEAKPPIGKLCAFVFIGNNNVCIGKFLNPYSWDKKFNENYIVYVAQRTDKYFEENHHKDIDRCELWLELPDIPIRF